MRPADCIEDGREGGGGEEVVLVEAGWRGISGCDGRGGGCEPGRVERGVQ